MNDIAHLTFFIANGGNSNISNVPEPIMAFQGRFVVGVGYYYGNSRVYTIKALETFPFNIDDDGYRYYIPACNTIANDAMREVLTRYASKYPAYADVCNRHIAKALNDGYFNIPMDDCVDANNFVLDTVTQSAVSRMIVEDPTNMYYGTNVRIYPTNQSTFDTIYAMKYLDTVGSQTDAYRVDDEMYYKLPNGYNNTIVIGFTNDYDKFICVGMIAIRPERLSIARGPSAGIMNIAPSIGFNDYYELFKCAVATMLVLYMKEQDIHYDTNQDIEVLGLDMKDASVMNNVEPKDMLNKTVVL